MRLAGASVFGGRLVKSVGILGLPRSGKTTLFEILMQGAGSAHGSAAAREDRQNIAKKQQQTDDRR